MRVLKFTSPQGLELMDGIPVPDPSENEALIKVLTAGICNTDIEITRGYMGFEGILGHEFVGVVVKVNAGDQNVLGKRVVGEINCICGDCHYCRKGLKRHCENRDVLGISGKNGCFADYVTLPVENLYVVPDSMRDEIAVFAEPMAAALEIQEQVHILPGMRVLVLGDGKLGLLIALSLQTTVADVSITGRYPEKLKIARNRGIRILQMDNLFDERFNIVVEATGSVEGFETALKLIEPRGFLVLKSTIAARKELDLTPVVINEITLVGSRCGCFEPALKVLKAQVDVRPLISAVFPFEQALDAFRKAEEKGIMKVLLDMR